MSWIVHEQRKNALNSMKNTLKKKKKISQEDMIVHLIRTFDFSEQTAKRYIKDIIRCGYAKANTDTLIFIEGSW